MLEDRVIHLEDSEMDELQTRLNAGSGDVITESGDDSDEKETAAGSKNEATAKALSFTQWQIESNDRFGPCGATETKLPPGMYTPSIDSEGALHLKKVPPITDKLVELEDSAGEVVLANVRKFWKSKDRYKHRGIVFKRGVLLWGPPGSGKTVIVQFLIRDLIQAGGIVLLAHSPAIVNQALQTLRRIEPDRALIVVLEDIDEIMEQYSEHELLALLDGEHQVDNVVNIATTNYPERLGARVINRPSRFDEVKKIAMPGDKAREQYLRHALGADLQELNEQGKLPEMAQIISETKNLSIAHLRELVVATTCLDHEYAATLQRLKGMKTKPKSTESTDGGAALGFANRDEYGDKENENG